jgi:hypothetical protein
MRRILDLLKTAYNHGLCRIRKSRDRHPEEALSSAKEKGVSSAALTKGRV